MEHGDKEKLSDATDPKHSPTPRTTAALDEKTFLWLVVAISIGFLAIIAPLYGAILWAIVIAVLFSGIQKSFCVRLKRPNWAALITVLLVLVIVVLPVTLLSIAVAKEATQVYDKIQTGELDLGGRLQKIFESAPPWISGWLDRFGLSTFGDLKDKLTHGVSQASKAVVLQAINFGQSTFTFLLNVFVMLYLLFFLFRDGEELVERIKRAVPLRRDHANSLITRINIVVRATIKGNVIVALVQGALGGLIFWILGIQGALLWGSLMALLSLLPAVGPALVWLPVAIYLLANHSVSKGVILILFGSLVIGLIDNLLRPLLVGKDTKMPDYLVLISTLGGIAVFGVNGFLIGPLIAAMFISVWDIFAESRQPKAKADPGTPARATESSA